MTGTASAQNDPTAAHVFETKTGARYTMRRKRDGSNVTAQQFADHRRNLSSAFSGTLIGRAGYAELYTLEAVK